ncbi:proteasome regulatory particle lid subunit [Saccharomycopsis crataegensis]|uniref:Proteasome regulatory particle lid subunit n=1 Tax=Saccharomycopsis crataegensis TaxID=43959 RepID=A0AAV5QJY9_9ASCO|nr:proteasome regulatory particle lid subunit [Saccharomycopsis crataegensis]
MSREAPLKAEKDFSETLNEQFPQIDILTKNDYQSALDKLLLLEKQTRQASDLESSKRVLGKIVEVLTSNNDWNLLNEQLTLLSKKHGQLKLSIQSMVQKIIESIDTISDTATKVEVIETIRTVTENKIYVEVERARVTRILTKIKLDQGDLDTAAELLCELQVETYGSMELNEKIEFILEQMELTIKKGDFEQAKILSRKILERTLNEDEFKVLKQRYFELKIKISLNDSDYLEVAKNYLKIYSIDTIQNDKQSLNEILINIVYFIILAPYDNLQHDLINKVYIDANLKNLETHYQLIKSFIKQELMRWPKIEETFGSEFKKSFVFSEPTIGDKRLGDLRSRVIEHNLRIISKYYSNISIQRINQLLDLSELETEQFISDLVFKGVIYAKINRPKKIVSFSKPKASNDLLNEWSRNVDELLSEIETIGHLITKEEIINEIKV